MESLCLICEKGDFFARIFDAFFHIFATDDGDDVKIHIENSGKKISFFWAADPKGTMSYRTEGEISVRPDKRTSERASVRS